MENEKNSNYTAAAAAAAGITSSCIMWLFWNALVFYGIRRVNVILFKAFGSKFLI